jgi:hypothetical protein
VLIKKKKLQIIENYAHLSKRLRQPVGIFTKSSMTSLTFIVNPKFMWLFIFIIPKSLQRSFVEEERSLVFKSLSFV